jgi:hypothetical protein
VIAELLVSAAGIGLLAWAWCADRDWYELHVGDHFCVWNPDELSALKTWRWIAVVAGLSLLLLLRPILGGWAGRRTGRGALAAVARVAGAAMFALVVSDLVLRVTHKMPPLGLPIMPSIHRDARYGWVHDGPKTTSILTDGRDIVYAINARGDRVRTESDLPDPERPTILIAGESIASGVGVQWDESFPALLEQQLGVQVVACGVQGYNVDQAYVRMRDELAALAHPIAVVLLIAAQEIARGADVERPHLSLTRDGSLTASLRHHPRWWVTSPVRDLAERVVFLHDDEALHIARAIFAETVQVARARGAYPLVLLTNWGFPCLPDATGAPSIERRCFAGLDVPHLRVDLDPAWEDQTTHHPGPKGHALMADAIERELLAAHVIAP